MQTNVTFQVLFGKAPGMVKNINLWSSFSFSHLLPDSQQASGVIKEGPLKTHLTMFGTFRLLESACSYYHLEDFDAVDVLKGGTSSVCPLTLLVGREVL